ncbi:MAG: preprotein translocase subunit SecG [Gemmatimonadetes bacterium]|nr:preprotein translocase subunit SecG [Gemmatimonadota bacterium]
MFTLLILILILDSLVLATVVLLQAGKGGGLAAMGGGASTESFFGGRQATTILTKLSWWCGGIFLFISLVLSAMSARTGIPRSVLDGQIQTPTPIQLPLPANPSTGVLRDSTGN